MPDSTRCRMISAPGDPPGSRVTMARSFAASRRSASFLICVDFPEPSPPSNVMNFPRPEGRLHRCLGHGQSFSALARNMPMTSSLAPSIARRMVEPVPTASAA